MASRITAVILMIATTASCLQVYRRNTRVYVDPYGGTGGSPFEFSGRNSPCVTLTAIRVEVISGILKSMTFWLSDRRNATQGFVTQGTFHDFEFLPGELVTSLSLWKVTIANTGVRLAAVNFKTSTGRVFSAQGSRLDSTTEYSVGVYSGVCVGVEGRSGTAVDSIGFQFREY